MSVNKPTEPYIYQPDRPNGDPDPRIYAISGPGADRYFGQRFTRAEAEQELKELKALIKRIDNCRV